METISGLGKYVVFNYIFPTVTLSSSFYVLVMLAETAAAVLDHAGDLANENLPRM